MPTWLASDGDKRLLYYIGWTVRNTIPYHNSLGVAVSYDGIHYDRLSEGPVMTSSFTEPFFVASACILKQNDQWIAWYLSCVGWIEIGGKQEPMYNIKYATSHDGINWQRPGIVCIELRENEGGISRPTVIREDGLFKMWYSYRGRDNFKSFSDHSYRIGYAESDDGIKWRRLDNKAGISVSPTGWDSDMVEYPLVIVVNNRKIMFYNGNGFGRTGFGYAVWEK
jgi:hypothetical protein